MIVSQWADWPTHFVSPEKKVPSGASSVIFTRENARLLCLIRGTFSACYPSWIFKNETVCLCRGEQLQFSLLQLSSGSGKKTSWSVPWFLRQSARGPWQLSLFPVVVKNSVPGCCKELRLDRLDRLLLFVVGNWPLPPLLPFCFVLVPGLLALRFSLSSKHALLYHRGLHAAGGI